MFPHERSLVQQYQGRPFALLGVNVNGDVGVQRRAEQRYGLTWRSWSDDGTISERWHVEGLPIVYLIDHRGDIRFSSMGPPDPEVLDRKIDKLVREAEADLNKS